MTPDKARDLLDGTWRPDIEYAFPAVVVAAGEHVRAAQQALEAADATD